MVKRQKLAVLTAELSLELKVSSMASGMGRTWMCGVVSDALHTRFVVVQPWRWD